MGWFQKFVEMGTETKYVPLGRKCDICGKKIGFFYTGFWSTNAARYTDGVLCKSCDQKIQLLLRYSPTWVKKELRKEPPYRGYSTSSRFSMDLPSAKLLLDSAEIFGKEELAQNGSTYSAIFRSKKCCVISPTALAVGIKRSKILKDKAVVFGYVQLGRFKEGDSVRILAKNRVIESTVLEAYEYDCPENTLEVNLKAHSGKQQLTQWQEGWIVLDTEETLYPSDTIIG